MYQIGSGRRSTVTLPPTLHRTEGPRPRYQSQRAAVFVVVGDYDVTGARHAMPPERRCAAGSVTGRRAFELARHIRYVPPKQRVLLAI